MFFDTHFPLSVLCAPLCTPIFPASPTKKLLFPPRVIISVWSLLHVCRSLTFASWLPSGVNSIHTGKFDVADQTCSCHQTRKHFALGVTNNLSLHLYYCPFHDTASLHLYYCPFNDTASLHLYYCHFHVTCLCISIYYCPFHDTSSLLLSFPTYLSLHLYHCPFHTISSFLLLPFPWYLSLHLSYCLKAPHNIEKRGNFTGYTSWRLWNHWV